MSFTAGDLSWWNPVSAIVDIYDDVAACSLTRL
jgi:hypothetical protein